MIVITDTRSRASLSLGFQAPTKFPFIRLAHPSYTKSCMDNN